MLDFSKSLWPLARPLLHALDPEAAHRLTIRALQSGLVPFAAGPDPASLAIQVLGLSFANPVGMAAGFDKNGEAIDGLHRLGFGFVEIGSVTPLAQPGNPKPRMFRIPTAGAVINRLGFNNEGLDAAAARLAARRSRGVLGANLGKNKDQTDAVADYVAGAARLSPLADYLVINVSSPNTPGLRELQHAPLGELVREVRAARARPIPLLVKIAPDLEPREIAAVVEAALGGGADGLIVSNTTLDRPSSIPAAVAKEAGGLSGKPLFARSTDVLRQVRKIAGPAVPLIGVGGIASGADAYAKIRAGASLVQLYTALVYEGPSLITRIKRDLASLLARDGITRLQDAVGLDVSDVRL
ncbi:quinone-dependent dihydroorotate dehydrogenase [Roseiterribacter gracilis]|uniref:Dihydroorotate dehydrogenase (quinone) n=1 Tax=Roseiterribacter gracilis TaxID=2812848 RepID=A0A8S8XDB0_9PROT|nr:dihydroorotate dehydrogenase (quinone) [Rhodospirillales bacterium TMPK1]